MNDTQSTQTSSAPQSEKLEFQITITNGAALRVKNLMEHFHSDTAKSVVGLALELLDVVKEGTGIVVENKDGSAKRLVIPPTIL